MIPLALLLALYQPPAAALVERGAAASFGVV